MNGTPLDVRRVVALALVAGAGLVAVVAGLAWDAALHAGDRMLAVREGLLSLGNPGHLLFAVGVFLTVAGSAAVVTLVLQAVAPTVRSLRGRRRAPATTPVPPAPPAGRRRRP